jgi:hypothetical protein
VVLGPLVGLVLWRGVGARWLVAAAFGLLALAVPALYVAFPAENHGGYDTFYAPEHLTAHWRGVGAVTLLGLALVRTLSRARARDAAGQG